MQCCKWSLVVEAACLWARGEGGRGIIFNGIFSMSTAVIVDDADHFLSLTTTAGEKTDIWHLRVYILASFTWCLHSCYSTFKKYGLAQYAWNVI